MTTLSCHSITPDLVGETWMLARGSIKSVVKELSKPKGRREPTKDFFYNATGLSLLYRRSLG